MFVARDRTIIIMPWFPATVSTIIKHSPGATVDKKCAGLVCMSVLAAMACLASLDWCHGDIKPDNILISSEKVEGVVKLRGGKPR